MVIAEASLAPVSSLALEIRNLSKTFAGARALKDVALEVKRGEVHGLLGHNGSGKSTLVKVLAGYHAPDTGAYLSLHGRVLSFPLPVGAFRSFGISFVHQNLGLASSLSVLENLRVAQTTARGRPFISWRHEEEEGRAALRRFGIDIDIRARVADLSFGDRALVAIVRAYEEINAGEIHRFNPGLLVLDEPTPFLPRESVDRLFSLVRKVTAAGASVIFISHDIDEVLEITNRATVLRDGAVIGTLETQHASRDDIVEMIVGHKIERAGALSGKTAQFRRRACITGLQDHRLAPLDFTIGAGEIVGITGLIGSGFERVASLLFGAVPARTGVLKLDNRTIDLANQTPRKAVSSGIALLPADRAHASGVGGLTIAENMMLPDLGRYFRKGRLDRRALMLRARALSREYEVRPAIPSLKLSALSGGNAQKVLLAKWLNRQPGLLLLDEPTQGVDVGSREQVYSAIRKAADAGAAVLCASSDHEQLADLCDRVLIFAHGRLQSEIRGAELTKSVIAARCYAVSAPIFPPAKSGLSS